MCISTTPAPDSAATPAHVRVARHRGDIVDDGGAGVEGPPGDFRLGRVDRDRHDEPFGQSLDDRDDPAQLFLE